LALLVNIVFPLKIFKKKNLFKKKKKKKKKKKNTKNPRIQQQKACMLTCLEWLELGVGGGAALRYLELISLFRAYINLAFPWKHHFEENLSLPEETSLLQGKDVFWKNNGNAGFKEA
jgi:hypothetical protein